MIVDTAVPTSGMRRPGRGRSRDPRIDTAALAVAGRHLAERGFEAMSYAAVADEAGTTRQALYRRWPTKSDLAAAATATMAIIDAPAQRSDIGGGPFAELVAELADFQRGVSRPGRMSLVGTMLQDSTEAESVARYRERVVAPRRRRLRAILARARALGLIDQAADLDVAVTMCTGAWYARTLAGGRVPARWPERTATLVWRAVGGATSSE